MEANRFDSITRFFASRRVSRRQALTGAAGSVAALAATGTASPSHGQEGSPATPVAGNGQAPEFLFIQAFQAGGITPADGTEGRYTLTLEQGLGHTVYFSDRPDRIVGAHPTPKFLAGLGFPQDNPPNAALIVETPEGETEIAVLELFSPVYDEATHTATYEVAVLAEFERDNGFSETDADLAELLPEFGAAHLFIDDCADADIWCESFNYDTAQKTTHGYYGYGVGHCYSWGEATCIVCGYPNQQQARAAFNDWCNANIPSCNGQCQAGGICTSGGECNPWWW
jgi:hypothetical protein